MFVDRNDAARQLADAMAPLRGQHPLVLAIPRGAVPMGRVVAQALGGDFDVVLVRKLRAPRQPELAIGSVDDTGWRHLSPYAADTGADDAYIEAEAQRQLATIRERRARYAPLHAPVDPAGRVVVVVDDVVVEDSVGTPRPPSGTFTTLTARA